jgi:hypothetical protein
LLSCTVIVSVVQILIYIITVSYDYDSDAFLKPKKDTLILFGAVDFEKMRYGYELWRFFTAGFLNASMQ